MTKTNGNFEKLVDRAVENALDTGFRALFDKAKYYDYSMTDSLNHNLREIKANLKRELRRNWKPQDW